MTEREVVDPTGEKPEIDEKLNMVLEFCLKEARKRMAEDPKWPPFVALAVSDKLIMETLHGETPDDLYEAARHTVQHVTGASCYALCYDGYVNTNEGKGEALIAEGGLPGEPDAYGIGITYTRETEDSEPVYAASSTYLGPAPNYMEFTGMDVVDEEIAEDDEAYFEEQEQDAEASSEE